MELISLAVQWLSMRDLYIFHGSLGSGKTTAIENLRETKRFENSVVIENELASENIDQEKIGENVYDISGLCVCCSTGNELNEALNEAYEHTEEDTPVILETTGAANIVNVLKKVVVNREFNKKYNIAASIFVIGLQNDLDIQEMKSEILVSDLVLLNKTDLVKEEKIEEYQSEIENIKQDVKILKTRNSKFSLDKLTEESKLNAYLADAVSEALEDEHEYDRYEVVEGLVFGSRKQFIDKFEEVSSEYPIGRMKGTIEIQGQRKFVEYSSGKLSFEEDREVRNDKMVVIGGENVYEAVQEIQKT